MILGATLSPFVICSAILLFFRSATFGTSVPIILFAVCVLSGIPFLSYLLATWRARVIAVVLYIPVVAVCLWFYALHFVCHVFGDCL